MHIISARAALRRATASSLAPSRSARLYSSTMHDNDPELLESEKRKNMGKTQHRTSTPHASAPGWNEHLASTSEAHVKADRSDEPIDTLARKTIDYVHSRHTPEEHVERREANYERDEVTGPLRSATGSEGPDDEEPSHVTSLKQTHHVKKVRVVEKLNLDNATPSEQAVKADRGEV